MKLRCKTPAEERVWDWWSHVKVEERGEGLDSR